jgi:hypothetical protein
MDIIDIGIYTTFVLFVIALGTAILLEVFNLVKEPKSLIFAGAVLVGVVVIFFIGYSMSTGNVTTKYTALGVDEGESKLIGAGLIMLYIFLFTSLAGMIVSEIYKLLK